MLFFIRAGCGRHMAFCAVASLASLAFTAAPRQGLADESVPSLGRKIFHQHKDAIVRVTGVAAIRMTATNRPGMNLPEREEKVKAEGTIIDSSGLIVLSLSAIDPSRLVDGREGNSPSGPIKVEASATLKELEIVLGDGTEIPATMVFKDTDLDLAFVRPKADAEEAKGVVFAPVNLADSGQSEVADYTVSLTQLDDLFNNHPAMLPGQISAVIQRPRPLYLGTNVVRGCPMFSLNGKLLGIGTLRLSKTQGQGQAIVPASEVQKLVEQIPASVATEEKIETQPEPGEKSSPDS